MDLGIIIISKNIHTKDNFIMIASMEKVQFTILMAIFIMDNGQIGKNREKVY